MYGDFWRCGGSMMKNLRPLCCIGVGEIGGVLYGRQYGKRMGRGRIEFHYSWLEFNMRRRMWTIVMMNGLPDPVEIARPASPTSIIEVPE